MPPEEGVKPSETAGTGAAGNRGGGDAGSGVSAPTGGGDMEGAAGAGAGMGTGGTGGPSLDGGVAPCDSPHAGDGGVTNDAGADSDGGPVLDGGVSVDVDAGADAACEGIDRDDAALQN